MIINDEATRLFRVVEDALWQLDQGYSIGATAILRGAVERERRRQGNDHPHIIYQEESNEQH